MERSVQGSIGKKRMLGHGMSIRPSKAVRVAALALAILVPGTAALSAENLFDTNISQRIRGISNETRAKLRHIERESEARLAIVLRKYRINPAGPFDMDTMIDASKELRAIGDAERREVLPLLKPEERAQYNAIVTATSDRIRKAVK
jgi:hypothetical protein